MDQMSSGTGNTGDAGLNVAMPCIGCGYDLRGLSKEGNCPECGRRVIDSQPGSPEVYKSIQDSDPAWVRRMASGLRCVTAYLAIQLAFWVVLVALFVLIAGVAIWVMAEEMHRDMSSDDLYVLLWTAGGVLALGRLVSMAPGVLAMRRMGAAEPGREKPVRWESWRKGTVVLGPVMAGVIILEMLTYLLILVFAHHFTTGWSHILLGYYMVWPWVQTGMIWGIYGCVYGSTELAGRLGDEGLIKDVKKARRMFEYFAIANLVHLAVLFVSCLSCLGIFSFPVVLVLMGLTVVNMARVYPRLARAVEGQIRQDAGSLAERG